MKAVPPQALQGHDMLVARSRALHWAVADRLRAQPELVALARQNLERWITTERQHGHVSPGLLEWKRILDTRPIEAILELLCEESEAADRLRHATPFCGILTEEERAAIYQHYAALPA